VFLYHEQAFVRTPAVIDALRRAYAALHRGRELVVIKVPAARVPLADAVRSYLFNSQIVTVNPGRLALIAPTDCQDVASVSGFIEHLLGRGRTPIGEVHFLDLKQSMRNGGGPACLRLRVVLTPDELAALPAGVRLTATTYDALVAWVKMHYRDKLTAADLADPALLAESRRALDALTQLLGLGSIYPFQQA
jgi:succinylarginine dihydrolase